jgi:hypothetical protein
VMLSSRSIGCWINGNRKSFIGPVLLTFPFVYVGVTLIVAVIGKDPGFILREGINISSPGSSQSN